MSNIEVSQAERLDQYVTRQYPYLSRAHGAKLVQTGKVTVNDTVQTKTGYKVRVSDVISIDYDPEVFQQIPDIDLEVLYEDKDCVVIYKPVGVLSHSKGAFNPEATVASWLRRHQETSKRKDVTEDMVNDRTGIVHRLDRATSGVMICAKSSEALFWLQKQFSQRRVKKTYLAVVQGTLPNDQAVIDMPIERNPRKPQTFRVGGNGKAAVTNYKLLKTNGKFSLLELKPLTGRTHQLRVHLNQLGHPIIGDTLYGGKKADRMLLHAFELELTLPDRQRVTFTAEVPPEFNEKVR